MDVIDSIKEAINQERNKLSEGKENLGTLEIGKLGKWTGLTRALRIIDEKTEQIQKWIFDDDGFDEYYGPWYECPKCGKSVAGCDAENFCPRCGARLEE